MDKDDDDQDEPSTWVSALKVIFGLAVLIGSVGFALWYADQQPYHSPALEEAIEVVKQKKSSNSTSGDGSWGIFKDSPLRK